jgi:histidine triad (HIT) family protein
MVYQDEHCSAIMDIQPINPGHMLVIPNEHYQDLKELPAELGQHMFATAQVLSEALKNSGILCQGVNIFIADGKAAMQEVMHFHIHVIPRYEDDGFGFHFSPRYAELPTREELENNAYYLKQALEIVWNKK